MTRHKRRTSFVVLGLLLSAGASHAQVAALGKGWLLNGGAIVTSATGRCDLRRAIPSGPRGSPPPGGQVTPILQTDPTFVHFLPNQSYTIRGAITSSRRDTPSFGDGFDSSEGQAPSATSGRATCLRGASGTSGPASRPPSRSGNHGDDLVLASSTAPDRSVIDDIRITDAQRSAGGIGERGRAGARSRTRWVFR